MTVSISDDDICARCTFCRYDPGKESNCDKDWPIAVVTNGDIKECPEFKECPPGSNWNLT